MSGPLRRERGSRTVESIAGVTSTPHGDPIDGNAIVGRLVPLILVRKEDRGSWITLTHARRACERVRWTETTNGSIRVYRGGSRGGNSVNLAAATLSGSTPSFEDKLVGFRVASIPEPSTSLLLLTGRACPIRC